MSIDTHITAISADTREEFEAVAEHVRTGKPVPPELSHRIREKAEKIRKQVFEKHGLVDVAVPAIRELRDDAPES